MPPVVESQNEKINTVILQGRVGKVYDVIKLEDHFCIARFTLLIEVKLLDDNNRVQTEVLSFMVNAFDGLAQQVKTTLHINDEVLVLGTSDEQDEQGSKNLENQIVAQQLRIISEAAHGSENKGINMENTSNLI